LHIHIFIQLFYKTIFFAATNKQASATPTTTSVRFKCQNTNERQNKIDEVQRARARAAARANAIERSLLQMTMRRRGENPLCILFTVINYRVNQYNLNFY